MPVATPTLPRPSARLIPPRGEGYDRLRTPWNVAVDQRPAAVALPGSASDVAAIVRAAAAAGQRVAVQGGAHNPGPLGDLAESVLVRTSAMSAVAIDPVRRWMRVEAGVLWEDALDVAAGHGLYPLHGSSPNVGVVGYSLGGGLGWAARRHGLQVNRIRAIELVTADGRIVRATDERERELFWALRGGGGGFGIVTAIEFELLPITQAHAGWLAWDWREAPRVLQRWARWTADAPDSATTAARILHVPPLPELPEPLRGRSLVVLDGAVLQDTRQARQTLGPLRELRPEIDTFATVPALALGRLHGDPEPPTPVVSGHALLRDLSEATVDALLGQAGPDADSSLVSTELRHLGGAVGMPVAGGGALSHLPGRFLLYGGAIAPTPDAAETGRADAARLLAALAPWSHPRRFANFTEERVDPLRIHDPQVWARLDAARRAADPTGLFQAAHLQR